MIAHVKSPGDFVLHGSFPNFYDEQWVAYTFQSLLESMRGEGCSISATVMAKGGAVDSSYVHSVFSPLVFRFAEPLVTNPTAWMARWLLKGMSAGDVAYLWLSSPPEFCKRIHAKGVMIAREMINCSLELRRGELRRAYRALGLPDHSGITDGDIEYERREILSSDAVFCPNPFVKQSMIDYGFPEENCIETSYGWAPLRLSGDALALPPADGFSLVFVGTVDVRKGIPWLLEAWARAGVKGRLILAGCLDPFIEERYAHILNREDVVVLGYVGDVGSVYRSADAFVMPTWEEGGPLVTLEAMALGLPVIVTPMGTSGVFSAEDDVGIVFPPGDADALVEAIRLLAADVELRKQMGIRAKERVQEYTWDKVGERRRDALIQRRDRWLSNR